MFLSAGDTKKEGKEEVSKMTDELSSKMESAKLEDKVNTNKDSASYRIMVQKPLSCPKCKIIDNQIGGHSSFK